MFRVRLLFPALTISFIRIGAKAVVEAFSRSQMSEDATHRLQEGKVFSV